MPVDVGPLLRRSIPVSETAIRTARLELRPLPLEAVRLVLSDRDEASRSIGASLHPDWPLDDVRALLGHLAGEPDPGDFGVWTIVELATRTVVGDAGFHGPPVDATVEIGYSVVSDRRRRGYATEAVSALVDWALSLDEVHEVVAECDPENVASVATLAGTGFVRTDEDGKRIQWRHSGSTARE